mmetsp:Transcript_38300/g.81772  ORF Transcript_38300/g.81772 Transcript_38300/m.81772 type:complete len:274 (-) Transcript_38300:2083-2904(-)
MVDVPVGEDAHTGESNVDANDHVAEEDPGGDEAVVGASGKLLHDVRIRGVESQRRGWGSISDEVNPEELHRDESLWQAQRGREEDGSDLPDVGRYEVADERLHVVVDGPSLLHRVHDGGEVVVREDHVRRLLGDLGAGQSHGDADVSLLEGRGIVDAVPRHGHYASLPLEELHKLLLVLGLSPREYESSVPLHQYLDLLGLALFEEVSASEALIWIKSLVEDVYVHCDGLSGELVVSSDHHDANPSRLAQLHRGCNLLARRIDDAHESNEGEV